MSRIFVGALLISSSVAFSYGQSNAFGYFEDALLFSQSNYSLGSTARMQAIAGASVSLGGDISSAVSNPAGLGFFNKGVFTLSPSLNFSNASTDFSIRDNELISSNETFRNNFNLANIGAVINWNKGRFSEDKFKGGSLAISISRNNSFQLNRGYEGRNSENSIIDFYARDFGGEIGFLAFDQYLVDEVLEEIDGELVAVGYQPYYEGDGGRSPLQNETIEERGSGYTTQFSWGGNYDDWFYFGGGIGFQTLNYQITRSLDEFDYERASDGQPDNLLNLVNDWSRLDLRGAGVDFNVGVIVRPVQFLTLGVSYVSPTFYSVNSELINDLTVDWADGVIFDDGVNDPIDIGGIETLGIVQPSDYTLRTPSKLRAGASLFVGKSGFLTGDIEFVDHAGSTINSNDFATSEDNLAIGAFYRSVVNVRVGGEYRIESFRLRAGYSFFPSPYADSNLNETTNVTFGIGYRTRDYFLDFAIVNTERSISYAPYFTTDGFQPLADSEITNTAVTATFGINF